MKREKELVATDRRGFLKLAGASTVLSGVAIAGEAAADTSAAPVDTSQGRYQETDHVRRVYQLARF